MSVDCFAEWWANEPKFSWVKRISDRNEEEETGGEVILIVIVSSLSHVRLFFATPWTTAHQAPLTVRFSRQEYWSGLPFPSPGDLPDPT